MSKRSWWWRLKEWWWHSRPIRCATCRRWFQQGDFWNPGISGVGLTCSDVCCAKAQGRPVEELRAECP